MKILLLARHIGPAEAAIWSRLIDDGHRVLVYDVDGAWMSPVRETPIWLKAYRLRRTVLATNYFAQIIEEEGIERVIASGLEACAFAATNLSIPFIPMLRSGSLDFSESRTAQTLEFERVLRATDRLLLENDWEMDKANAKGSQNPHFLIPDPVSNSTAVLRRTGAPKIALIHPRDFAQDRLDSLLNAISIAQPDVEVNAREVDYFYRSKDLNRSHYLVDTLKTRLSDFTHVLMVGFSPHIAALISMLYSDRDRVVIDESIGARFHCRNLGMPHVGRGQRLVEVLNDLIAEPAPFCGPVDQENTEEAISTDYLVQLDEIMSRVVSSRFEELPALEAPEPLNVFFSTAALEDRTNGARPQRIRNISEAFELNGPTIRVFSGESAYLRRAALIREIVASGRRVNLFYGENSTSPIASDRVVDDLPNLLEDLASAGGKSGWFVRDLHWLEDIDGYLDDRELLEQSRSRGLHELDSLEKAVNVLFAPCTASGVGFNELLEKVGARPRVWESLPPGIAQSNVVNVSNLAVNQSEGVTLLYTGGTNAVYGMDLYLSALKLLPSEGYYFDFVVRESELLSLRDALTRHGLAEDPRLKITTVAFDMYIPRTSHCIGVILLDSEYARFSFPYKTVSMLERGLPILCYEDMAIANFLLERELGYACTRSPEAIVEGIAATLGVNEKAIHQAQTTESWSARVRRITQVVGG